MALGFALPLARTPGTLHHEAKVIAQLDEYFTGRRRDFDLTLAPRGTEFQLAVWRELPDRVRHHN